MKKIICLFITLLLITGCTTKKEETPKKEETKKEEEPVVEKYEDENTTPIGLYELYGNTLRRLDRIDRELIVEEDVGIFQVFPSNEDVVELNNGFAEDFYNTWTSLNPDKKIKIGFNIKFKKNNGEVINYNIMDPSHTFDQWEYFMNYIYDDYAHRGEGFYSHVEEFDENTLYTAFKMQSSYSSGEIASKVELTVFTYDTDDDFGDDSIYRGNSKHTLTICIPNYEC